MTRQPDLNSTMTLSLIGAGVEWLQTAVATAGPATIVHLAVDTAADGTQTGRFKIDQGTWSPPFYAAAAVDAPAYDLEPRP